MPKPNSQWWQSAFFGLHYDLHARADDTNLGAELSHEHLLRQLQKVAPDFVQCDCKGHPGYTSYPTKVGSPSPGIIKDALRIFRDVTREMGVPLSVHYSGLWDTRAVELHPDWAVVGADDKPLTNLAEGYGVVCPRSPYLQELMIPQLREILTEYGVDGIWVDGDNWAVRDCYCPRCQEEFKRRTGVETPPADPKAPHWTEWRAFHRDSFVEYVRTYADAVHRIEPDCAVCSNWIYTMRQPGPVSLPVDYLSGDFTPSFGCERAQMEGRYIAGHGMPWNLMAWTFCQSDPSLPKTMKSVEHLCQETAEVMSCGGSVFIYNQPQRSGWLTGWHQDIFAEVARFCRKRQPFSQHTTSIPESVVLVADGHVWKNNPMPFCLGDSYHGQEGALHVLMENHFHVDILDETRLREQIHKYSLVVVPEQDLVSDAVLQALEDYASTGGTVLITGAHLADTCSQLVGVEATGEPVESEWYLPVGEECAALRGPWRPVRITDSEAIACVMLDQQPGKDETEFPAVTRRRVGTGNVVAIHGAFMATYYSSHQPRMRKFLGRLLHEIPVAKKIELTAPPSVEVTLRASGNRRFVHLVNRAVNPTLTPRLHLVEKVPPAQAVEIRLRLEKKPEKVTLEPGGRSLHWSFSKGWLKAEVSSVEIHDILSVELPHDEL